MRSFICLLTVVALISAFRLSSTVASDNWAQWRGGKLDNTSGETDLPIDFDKENNLLWRIEMPGAAGSSPIVWDDRVFATTADGDELALLAFTTKGAKLWSAKLGGQNRQLRMDIANYASPSPATDGKHVWATSSAGVLHCFAMDGSPIWTLDLQEKYGKFEIQFGMSSTPVLDGDRLYLQLIHGEMRDKGPGTGIVLALEAATGKEIWRANRETDAAFENKHSYASPTIYRDNDRAFLITHGGDYVIGHALEDGHELWRCGGLNPKPTYNNFLRLVSSPATAPGMIVVPSAKNGPVFCLKPDITGDVTDKPDAKLWHMDRGTPDVASPLIHDGLVYMCIETGVFVCLDAKSGETIYKERILADQHRSTPVVVGDRIYVTGRKGTVVVLATGRELKILSENELGETTTASPAVANGQIYIRTFNALYAFGHGK